MSDSSNRKSNDEEDRGSDVVAPVNMSEEQIDVRLTPTSTTAMTDEDVEIDVEKISSMGTVEKNYNNAADGEENAFVIDESDDVAIDDVTTVDDESEEGKPMLEKDHRADINVSTNAHDDKAGDNMNSGPPPGRTSPPTRKSTGGPKESDDEQIRRLEQKTDAITGKMKDNLDEIMKRDVMLEDLEDTACTLAQDAKQFHQSTKKVNRKMWWKNQKWNIVIGVVVVVALTAIALGIAGSLGAFK